MRLERPRLGACLVLLPALLGYSSICNGQACPAPQGDDLWRAGSGIALPDASPYFFDDCTSEIDGTVEDLSPDGWVLNVIDDDGQKQGDDEDRSAYCKTGVFLNACQPAVFEVHVRTISGDSDPPHGITDIVLRCGLRDGSKDLTLVITEKKVGFTDGNNSLGWLQISDGGGGRMDAMVTVGDGDGNTKDKQHLYRVEKDGEDTITLFVDQKEVLSFDYDELTDMALNQSHLATTSAPGESEFRLRYYRHRVGATVFQTPSVGCDADFNNDDVVDTVDLLALLGNWGPCPESPATCPWDLDDDDVVGVTDLLSLLGSWGPCT